MVYNGGTYRFQECYTVGLNRSFYIFEDDWSVYQNKVYFSRFRRVLIFEFNAGKLKDVHYYPKEVFGSNALRDLEKGYFNYQNNQGFHMAFALSFQRSKYVDFNYEITNPNKDNIYIMDITIPRDGNATYNVLYKDNSKMTPYAVVDFSAESHTPVQPIYYSTYGLLLNNQIGGYSYLSLVKLNQP
jgi:hypothetical protein